MGREVSSLKSVPTPGTGRHRVVWTTTGHLAHRLSGSPPLSPAQPHCLPRALRPWLRFGSTGGDVRQREWFDLPSKKSHTPQFRSKPQPAVPLSRLPSFPPAASSPGRVPGHAGLPLETYQAAPTPHSRASRAPSGSYLVQAGDGSRMTPSAPSSVVCGGRGGSQQQSLHPSPRAGRGGWEAPRAPGKKEGAGRAGRGVLARKETRAPATCSWGGCRRDAPP